jgi:Flp pilus assembly protein TadG
MMVSPMQKMSLRVRDLLNDRSGLAAVEFAFVFPMMVVMYFGVVELSSAIAVDRKATQVARTLSDLTSQSVSVADADLINFGQAAKAIMTPYPPSPLIFSITEVYVDKTTAVARVQWSKGLTIDTSGNVAIAATAPHNTGDVVVLPPGLVVAKAKGTYVIWSEVSYKYTPTVGYVLASTGITFRDAAFTRPRRTLCVVYPTGGPTACPES